MDAKTTIYNYPYKYRDGLARLRTALERHAPVLARRGSIVLSRDESGEPVLRLGVPSRAILGYVGGPADEPVLSPVDDDGTDIPMTDARRIAFLAARILAAEAGGGLHAVLPDWKVKNLPPAAIFAPSEAGGFILSMGDDRLESLAKVRARASRAAVDAAFAVISQSFEEAFAKADTIVKNGAVYGDYNIPVAYVTTDYRKGLIIVSDADGSLEGFKPGRNEPVDWADMEYVVRPMIETTERWLREHDYYIGVD